MKIDVKADIDNTIRALQGHPEAAGRAIRAAMQRAVTTARAEAARLISAHYAISPSAAKSALDAMVRGTGADVTGHIVAEGAAIPLTHFPHTPAQPGTGGKGRPQLAIEITRGKPTELRGAFVAGIGGRLRIAQRKGRERFPIRTLSTISVAGMLGAQSDAVLERAAAAFRERLPREIDRQLGRIK